MVNALTPFYNRKNPFHLKGFFLFSNWSFLLPGKIPERVVADS